MTVIVDAGSIEICNGIDDDCDGDIDEGDGIKNGDEEGIDCGGSCPPALLPRLSAVCLRFM